MAARRAGGKRGGWMAGIAVIARQRSGTNFLRTLVANSSDLPNLGEVFDIKYAHFDMNFFGLRAAQGYTEPSPRSRAHCVAELDAYFAYLQQRHPWPMVDIKYNQTMICTATSQSPAETPPLFEVLAARGFGLVHLVREEVCATIVSGHVAQRTGVWHVPRAAGAEAEPHATVRIEPKTFVGEIQRREREFAIFDDLCADAGRMLRVRYEDANTAGPEQLAALVQDICALGGATFRELGQPAYKKGLGHWLDYVANGPELVAAIAAVPALRRHVAGLV